METFLYAWYIMLNLPDIDGTPLFCFSTRVTYLSCSATDLIKIKKIDIMAYKQILGTYKVVRWWSKSRISYKKYKLIISIEIKISKTYKGNDFVSSPLSMKKSNNRQQITDMETVRSWIKTTIHTLRRAYQTLFEIRRALKEKIKIILGLVHNDD